MSARRSQLASFQRRIGGDFYRSFLTDSRVHPFRARPLTLTKRSRLRSTVSVSIGDDALPSVRHPGSGLYNSRLDRIGPFRHRPLAGPSLLDGIKRVFDGHATICGRTSRIARRCRKATDPSNPSSVYQRRMSEDAALVDHRDPVALPTRSSHGVPEPQL